VFGGRGHSPSGRDGHETSVTQVRDRGGHRHMSIKTKRRAPWSPHCTWAPACLALTLGCTGQIGEPPTLAHPASTESGSAGSTGSGTTTGTTGPVSTGTTGTDSTGTMGSGSTGTTTGGPASSCSGGIKDIDDTPLRRLTNAEYLNTVSDL